MNISKKILLGFLAITIIVHSLFLPLALPGFVFCFGSDGHLAIEREIDVQHEHNVSHFITNIQTIVNTENCQYHLENCFDISLDRDNDYQNKHSKISLKISWEITNLLETIQEEKHDFFLTNHFITNLNKFTPEPITSLSKTHLLI